MSFKTGAIIFICFYFVFNFQMVFSQTVIQVGNGTATNTSATVTPYSTGWSDSRKQYLYLASEIISAGGFAGDISAVGFNITAHYSSQMMNSFTIKMGHTPNTVLSSTSFAASGILVSHYSAPTNVTGTGWTTHSFVNPFVWDGINNIIVEVCFDNNTYTSNNVIQVTGQGVNRVLGFGDDGASGCNVNTGSYSQNRPNIQLTFASCAPPIVSVSGANSFCDGAGTTLTANALPGTGTIIGYQWQLNGVDIGSANSSMFTVTTPGSYTVIVSNSGGCSTTSIPTNVSVTPLPVAGFSFNSIAGEVTFTNESDFGISYTWDFGDGSPAVTTSDPSHTFLTDGTYTVTLIATNNCGSDTITQQVVITGTGFSVEPADLAFSIFPNPATDLFTVHLNTFKSNELFFEIYEMSGALIFSSNEKLNYGPIVRTFNFPGFAAGSYLIKMFTGESSYFKTLIIK